MKQKRYSVDQIIAKLRRTDVELGKGKKVPEVLTAVQDCGAGRVSRRSDSSAHRCAARENRDDDGMSHHLSQIRREAQECTLTWSFGPRSVAVC